MTSRTTYTTITFAHPFCLKGFDAPQPAGSYTVRTEEELLEGLSFAAYGRIATEISIPVDRAGPGSIQVVTTDPLELESASAADRAKIVEPQDAPATLTSPLVDADEGFSNKQPLAQALEPASLSPKLGKGF